VAGFHWNEWTNSSEYARLADCILQSLSGKLEVLHLALSSGELTENLQHGMKAILDTMLAEVDQAGALIALA
jgi:hypothetical protein